MGYLLCFILLCIIIYVLYKNNRILKGIKKTFKKYFLNYKSYKVEYKITCKGDNNEALELSDIINNELTELGKINKIYIDEITEVKNKDKVIILEGEIGRQLINNTEKINHGNFKISYKDKENYIKGKHECHIIEEQGFKDINQFKDNFQLFLRSIFMVLCIINGDFYVGKNIANQIEKENNKDKFLYILYKYRTHSAKKKDLLEIYDFYKKYPKIKTAQCLPFHLYENGLIKESIDIAHKHINIYQGNPSSYTDLAFLYLSEGKELDSFYEYEKMSKRFDKKIIKNKCSIKKIINHINKQNDEKFVLGKYYLSQYLEVNPYIEDIKNYIKKQNNEIIKNHFLNMIK